MPMLRKIDKEQLKKITEDMVKMTKQMHIPNSRGCLFPIEPITGPNDQIYFIKFEKTKWYERLYEKIIKKTKYFYYKKRYGVTCKCYCHLAGPGFYHCFSPECCHQSNFQYKDLKKKGIINEHKMENQICND